MITDPGRRHDHITAVVLAALVGLAGIGAQLRAVLLATGHPVLTGLALATLALVPVAARHAARAIRERRENAADALAAAAWRARHMPDHHRTEVA
ncbi:hypothetical protein [Pseudonocardia charpentierae]|uniref:Uncharacterized protein n=1 Tax=Pseudonocardia charpentierae TaxID=3075545 RepID=A0ABU2NDB8_9PSEU|nr:hypothetical protein [Pseudonocardia sp. DSM 45834]MDT0351715.1 hypothetical protein [Pseudonocardia sp. DSM 45834]